MRHCADQTCVVIVRESGRSSTPRRPGSSLEVPDYRMPRLAPSLKLRRPTIMTPGEASGVDGSRGMTPQMVSARFARRLCLDRQRMHGAGQFPGQCGINHAVAFDPALPLERRRHNIHPEVRLAARPVAGMALMQM